MKRILLFAFALLSASAYAADFRHFFTSNTARRVATVAASTISLTDYGQTRYALAHGYHETNAPGLVSGPFAEVKFLPLGAMVAGELLPRFFPRHRDIFNTLFMFGGAAEAAVTLPFVIHNAGQLGK